MDGKLCGVLCAKDQGKCTIKWKLIPWEGKSTFLTLSRNYSLLIYSLKFNRIFNNRLCLAMRIMIVFNMKFWLFLNLHSGEKATAECVADAIADNRAELVHLPSAIDLNAPLPSKECPTCDGTVSLIYILRENFLNWTIFGFDPQFKHVLPVGSNALSRMQAQNTSQDLCGWCELFLSPSAYGMFDDLHFLE